MGFRTLNSLILVEQATLSRPLLDYLSLVEISEKKAQFSEKLRDSYLFSRKALPLDGDH
jgi:hypothetical protein